MSGDSFVLLDGTASGDIIHCQEGLSFWGGVDPDTGIIIDTKHPQHGQCISGKITLMPSSRGSCSGSGVLLALALADKAPACLIFSEAEEILTLGALVAARIFDKTIPVIRLSQDAYQAVKEAPSARLEKGQLITASHNFALKPLAVEEMALEDTDKAYLSGTHGKAAQIAMEIICLMARATGTNKLINVTKGHIDGCILAHNANLIFAETLSDLGAKVGIPTTINAISVDREHWQTQGLDAEFGARASRLADAYVSMGAKPVFTCAPYLLEGAPEFGEAVGWSESNAVIYANSVRGARSLKHPDYLDLFIAMTGRAPCTGVYLDEGRRPASIITIQAPDTPIDDAFWPLMGWLAGTLSPIHVPVIEGLESLAASPDDLKAFCAAFGTTSAAPLVHIAGHTPEANLAPLPGAVEIAAHKQAWRAAWHSLNPDRTDVNVIAIGSPHASFSELARLDHILAGRSLSPDITVIATTSRAELKKLQEARIYERLITAGIILYSDLCWCSITEPLFPPQTRALMTNSAKYAHYAPGLCGKPANLASLQDCVQTAVTGRTSMALPEWLS